MIEIVGISETKSIPSGKVSYNNIRNFVSHIFLVDNKFVFSKFVTTFLERYAIDEFDYELFVLTQLRLLENPSFLFKEKITIDLSDKKFEESLAIINFIEVIQNYTKLLGINDVYEKIISFFGQDDLINKYVDFKKFLIKDIYFLPEELSWSYNNIKVSSIGDKGKDAFDLAKDIVFKDKINYTLKPIYHPTRSTVRFFLYHFFGTLKKDKDGENFKPMFSTFSEEINDTVNLDTIFEPEKYIDPNTYKDFNAVMQEGGQYDIISAILQNKNTLGIMSTGAGKSITFLLSGMLKPGSTFVVAPLKSLIDDQYFNLEKKFNLRGITDKIHGGLSDDDKKKNIQNLNLGKNKFFYCAPERLQIKKFFEDIFASGTSESFTISQVVVDEAHCVSEWGHDFRFSYLNISLFNEHIKQKNITNVPIVGLTATASDIVKKDIISYLGISYVVEESTLNRPNLSLEINSNIPKNDEDSPRLDSSIKKPEIVKEYLDTKIDEILGHVAGKKKINIKSISTKGENGYDGAGMVFTIYGGRGKKTSKDSISQSAEGIFDYLKENYKDTEYINMFFSESPNFETLACPECTSTEILESKIGTNSYYLYYDNVEQKHITNTYNFDTPRTERMYKRIEKNSIFYVCNNPACGRKSFNYNDGNLSKPKVEKLIEEDNEGGNKNSLWERVKSRLHNDFKENKIGLLIATKGFGMGIDKSNIRYIVHGTLSGSLESYYQEIGRAGRDREHSHCVLLFVGPNKKCLKETSNLENDLPCLKDPECFKYQKCKTGEGTMCDIARQQKMMMNFIVVKIKKENKTKKDQWFEDFLHNYLFSKEIVSEPYQTEISTVGEKNIRKILYENMTSSFSHPLIEFWQLYFFYYDMIKKNEKQAIIEVELNETSDSINIGGVKHKKPIRYDSSGYEKMIYRLMCLGIVSHYFNEYVGGQKRVFHIHLNQNLDIEQSLNNYLTKLLGKDSTKDDSRLEGLDQYPELKEWIITAEDNMIKYFWKLVYYIYKKLEPQKKETLRYLYLAIQDAEEKGKCFRMGILNRLSGLSRKKNTKEGCGFCSACKSDLKFEKTEGTLEVDKNIRESNRILKKLFSGEKLTEEEEKKLQEQSSIAHIEGKIRSMFENIKMMKDVFDLIDLVNKEKYIITGLIQRKIESGADFLGYYLLSAYYENQLREERINKVLDILNKEKDSQGIFELGQWLSDVKDKNKKEILEKIENNKKLDLFRRFFEIGLISKKIDSENFEKIAVIAKAYDSFTSLNKK